MDRGRTILIVGSLLPVLMGCNGPAETRRGDDFAVAEDVLPTRPVTDLQFKDVLLQEIATHLVREARSRGIEEVSGATRIECLLRLEASLGRSQLALDRVNELVSHFTANDAGSWAKIRQQTEMRFGRRKDEGARRVNALMERWRHRKAEIAFEYLSSNYSRFISSAEWERRFHEFVVAQPADTATWAWLLMQNDPEGLRQLYGRVNAELAYRNYLEARGVGGAKEARQLFSVPGIEISEDSTPASD
jgi:hypothetical protein